jgi:hypothetical protein
MQMMTRHLDSELALQSLPPITTFLSTPTQIPTGCGLASVTGPNAIYVSGYARGCIDLGYRLALDTSGAQSPCLPKALTAA